MGKTKIKTIDDAAAEEPKAKAAKEPKKKLGRQDDLVEKLKAELGVEEVQPAKAEETVKGSEGGDAEDPAAAGRRMTGASRLPAGESEDVGAHSIEGTETEAAGPASEDKEEKPTKATSPAKKSRKPGKAKPRSKKYQEAVKDLDRAQVYPVNEAIELVKKTSYSKFDGTLEAHINTAQTGIRGLVSLPFVTGKKLNILAFGQDADKSGADVAGDDSTIEELTKGKVNFDLVITTPDWMPKLARAAKILGPRGLMPNPKNGTITNDLKKTVESFQEGKTEYRTEAKAPVIHLALGKLNQPTEELAQNIKVLFVTLGKSRIKKITLAPTIGPGVKLDLASL